MSAHVTECVDKEWLCILFLLGNDSSIHARKWTYGRELFAAQHLFRIFKNATQLNLKYNLKV